MTTTLRDTRLILSLSIQPTGALIQRQVFEQILLISDEFVHRFLEFCILLDYLALVLTGLYDFLFVGWSDDLCIIWLAVITMVLSYAPIPQTQATG